MCLREAICRFRDRIGGIVEPVIQYAVADRPRPSRIPRHAMALLVAATLIGCGGGQMHPDPGVAEAAPPPIDEPEPFPGEHPDAGTTQPPFQDDDGVAEMAPEPYIEDDGVAEAAPPPIDIQKR